MLAYLIKSHLNLLFFNYLFLWEEKADHVKKLANMLKEKSYDTYLIATDKDREGEGIAYHVYDFLKEHNVKGEIHRITFNEITKKAVLNLTNKCKIWFKSSLASIIPI